MTFVVTARKWRPQLFSEVVGQQHITTTLKNAIENNRIGHAYIFAGPRGVGKTTTARILAKRLNCSIPNGGEPCNECDACKNFLRSQSLDIIEIDGASNRRIDEIRTLRESVKYAPTSGEYKVYIIDEVHMLTTESFNALLKTLEEPPEHTIFIFATTDIHKVPLTIISRCQRFDFRRIELDEIKNLLKTIAESDKILIDDESLTLIAKKADGALRDAESIFDQVVSFCGGNVDVNILRQMLNIIDDDIYFTISKSIIDKNYKAAFEVSDLIYQNGWNYVDFVNGLVEHFRNISSVVISKTVNFIESSEIIKERYFEYQDKFSNGDILRILSFLSKTQNELRNSQNQKLKVEIALTHLIGLEKSSTITELLQKVDFPTELDKKKSPDIDKSNKNDLSEKFIEENKSSTSQNEEKKVVQSITKPAKLAIKTNKEQSRIKNDSKISLEIVQQQWDTYKNIINSERFTLGPLLDHALPLKIENNNLHISVNNKDDIHILEISNEFLSKKLSLLLKSNLKIIFQFEKNATQKDVLNLELETNQTNNNEHPLITKIIAELGGREIK